MIVSQCLIISRSVLKGVRWFDVAANNRLDEDQVVKCKFLNQYNPGFWTVENLADYFEVDTEVIEAVLCTSRQTK